MKRVAAFIVPLLLLLAAAVPAQAATDREYVILVGGPALMQWEKYKAQPHDTWWANFVRAGRIRTEQLRERYGPEAKITWLVYKQGYIDRGKQDSRDYIEFIESVRDKFNLNLVWFRNGDDVINYLNSGMPRDQVKIGFFEFFGHSNKACFMFDYSSNVESASKSFLHQSQFTQINRRAFTKDALVRSWGCHTGEMMSQHWYKAVGNRMWGAIGKTQYQTHDLPYISTKGGRWTN